MKKRHIRISPAVCLLCAVLMLAAAFCEGTEPLLVEATGNKALTSDSIKDKQNQISKAEKEKESLKNSLTDLKTVKKELEKKKKNLASYVAELDNTLSEIEQNISRLKAQITATEEEIVHMEEELTVAQAQESSQKDSMILRIRLMYEKGNASAMDMVLGAKGLGDFLNRADFMESVMAYDHQRWEEYIETRKLIELSKEELELEKEILDQAKANVEIEQKNLESLIAQKTKDLTAYESDISTQEKAIKEYEQMIAEQDAEIKALEAAIAEEKKQMMQDNGVKYDGGTFKFPVASYTRLSDDYGWRIHPTLNVNQFHNGIDLAAPKGTAIYAAYDGKVVAATYSSTMGNYVMIDHGDSLYTIYMHASALYVSKGDVVTRGETIAAVGTTGRSTGNHLHFGVRKNGEYVSPWNYLSK